MATVHDRMNAAGPKKILACDGGGILGLITVEVLAKLEADLREKLANPTLVLGDWFDWVCGTSTGAIIATCISAGMSMDTLRDFYVGSGEQMFDKASIFKRLRYGYNDEPLAALLRSEINRALGYDAGESPATLGDPRLRTLLMMVLRNHTTDSPWPISNNPLAKYNHRDRKDCNLALPLWQLVRASTAAPTYFPPEVVTFGRDTPNEYQFVFVDGGVTTYNNPAFLAFQMVTAAPYRVSWATGVDKLLVVSVGTGNAAKARPDLVASDLWLLDHAKNIPAALMNAASAGWDMACRIVGECRFGAPIDRELGEMTVDDDNAMAPSNWTGPKQFAYARYDPELTQPSLNAMGLTDVKADNIQVLDSVKFIPDIQGVGRAYAERSFKLAHLRNFV